MECFVCLTDTGQPVYSVCRCSSAYVHEDCFKRLVNVPSHATHCAVCGHAYDMTVSWRWRVVVSVLLSVHCLFSVFILLCVPVLLHVHTAPNGPLLVTFRVVMYVAVGVAALTTPYGVYMHWRRTGHVCCVWMERETVKKTLRLPPKETEVHVSRI